MSKIERMGYVRKQKECGVRVGDKVKVLRKAKAYENNWQNEWPKEMDEFIGKVGTVLYDQGVFGLALQFIGINLTNYAFPYFVLEKVENSSTTSATSSCPKCNHQLREAYSDWAKTNIKKCSSCGWC